MADSHDFNFILADRTIRIDDFRSVSKQRLSHILPSVPAITIRQARDRQLQSACASIGVDRLDYSKELRSGFLRSRNSPDATGLAWQVTYLQIAPKSCSEIPEYADIEQAIGSAARRINGSYGEADWTPICYINRAFSHSTLAGLYRAARVGLVTPPRDGMNLVAKEYVASQNPEDPGVLVLSRFAGAAQELNAARIPTGTSSPACPAPGPSAPPACSPR